jgi:hypothetical protein
MIIDSKDGTSRRHFGNCLKSLYKVEHCKQKPFTLKTEATHQKGGGTGKICYKILTL